MHPEEEQSHLDRDAHRLFLDRLKPGTEPPADGEPTDKTGEREPGPEISAKHVPGS
jgi:hypothetical protein